LAFWRRRRAPDCRIQGANLPVEFDSEVDQLETVGDLGIDTAFNMTKPTSIAV
jgi:hypothetical protein